MSADGTADMAVHTTTAERRQREFSVHTPSKRSTWVRLIRPLPATPFKPPAWGLVGSGDALMSIKVRPPVRG